MEREEERRGEERAKTIKGRDAGKKWRREEETSGRKEG